MRGHSRRLKTSLSPSTEHSGKEKAKERDRDEREKKFKDREKEKKKYKAVNNIKRENGEVKQPIKGWWKHAPAANVFEIERKRLPPPGRSSGVVELDNGHPSPPLLGVAGSNGSA